MASELEVGKVGVGVAPTATLHVNSEINGVDAIVDNPTHNTQFLIKASAANKNSEILFGDSAADDVGKIDYDHNDNSLKLNTNSATRLTIDASGNVKLGTGSLAAVGSGPTRGLVGAAPEITLRDSATGTPYAVMRTNDNGNLILEADSGDDAASSQIEFKVDGATAATIASGGLATFSGGIVTSQKGIISGSVTVADDAVTTITPQRKGGFINILADTTAGDGGYPVKSDSAQIWFDCGSSLNIEKLDIGSVIGSQVETSTSNLTGTTGTDGRVTVSVQSDVIQIENRQNATRIFNYTIIC